MLDTKDVLYMCLKKKKKQYGRYVSLKIADRWLIDSTYEAVDIQQN